MEIRRLRVCDVCSPQMVAKLADADTFFANMDDDEVAVIYNQRTGSAREVDSPGNELFLPFVERVLLQKRSPQELAMRGDVRESST